MMPREIDDLILATVEAADRAEGGRALSLAACTALERSLGEQVGKIIDEREEAITRQFELEEAERTRVGRFLRRLSRLVEAS